MQSLIAAIKVEGIVDCVCNYVDGISQNLRILNPYWPGPLTVFSFLRIIVKQVKSSSKTS